MPPVADKTKEERLKETIRLLKALQSHGYSEKDGGYRQIKEMMSKWVTDGEAAEAKIDFFKQNRIAEVSLPKRANKAATINLKVVRREGEEETETETGQEQE